MLDYKSIVKLKKLGLNNSAISNSLHFKWETIQRVISRCKNIWGSIDGVPDDLRLWQQKRSTKAPFKNIISILIPIIVEYEKITQNPLLQEAYHLQCLLQ
jgi:hypothetical protein